MTATELEILERLATEYEMGAKDLCQLRSPYISQEKFFAEIGFLVTKGFATDGTGPGFYKITEAGRMRLREAETRS